MSKTQVSPEKIESFLNGHGNIKYIVAVEAPYHINEVYLIINHPEKGKYIETHKYEPFLWIKHDVSTKLYGGNRKEILTAMQKYGVKIKALRTNDDNGNIPQRLENGYKYIVTCKYSYNHLTNFFKDGGVDIFEQDNKDLFTIVAPSEQYMIQSGNRLFKGIDDYNDLLKYHFDLETEGLDPKIHSIFQIGIKTNKGYEKVLETLGNTPQEKRDSERENIIEFFQIISQIKPDVICGYNSESFDWPFFFERCDRLSLKITDVAKTLYSKSNIRRKKATLKLGNETENYISTLMWGYNILDISHGVRRAQAINSNIKKWNLKYITKFSKVAKPNRVYIKGDRIYKTWIDKENKYAFNDTNGDWYKITDTKPITENYIEVNGNYIVQRYLLDDLWETEQIDSIFNQASFLLGKIVPTTYARSSTMGTAGTWKLIMLAWSYENNLAIPSLEKKRDFTGGLSRLLQVGYSKNLSKMDYAALYPKTQLTDDIFPDLDITGVMYGLLTYIVDTRDDSKFLIEEHKEHIDRINELISQNNYSDSELAKFKTELAYHESLVILYDRKQSPLKVLANSWFGSYGASYLFNWGSIDLAEETTCRGRQYLRLMVKHFTEKHNFIAILLDTDGVNFSMPESINDFKYLVKGTHWKTKKYANKELTGVNAALAEFNETYMIGRMGLDVDEMMDATINFSRKNYANLINGKVKLTGNTIKSKKLPIYIEEFIDIGITLLLNDKGHEFIEHYYNYVDKIYNYQIPIIKIASKSKIKSSIAEYKKRCKQKNKAGNPMAKQAHMELVIKEGLDVNLGDEIFYVNTGSSKSQGDVRTVKNKGKGTVELQINCKLIPTEQLESNPDLTTEDYNVPKYLSAFNKRIKPLLVCFDPEIRNRLLIDIVKDKKSKTSKLKERSYFTHNECKLIAGKPYLSKHQDTYEELMTMEDKEIKFWIKVNKIPNNIDLNEWEEIKKDYLIRFEKQKEDGIKNEKELLLDIFKRLELDELNNIENFNEISDKILKIADLNDESFLISKKWDEVLWHFNCIFDYEKDAKDRDLFYQTLDENVKKKDRYDVWFKYKSETDTAYSSETKNLISEPIISEVQKVTESNNEWGF